MGIKITGTELATVSPNEMRPGQIGRIALFIHDRHINKIVQRTEDELVEIGGVGGWNNLRSLKSMKIEILPIGTTLRIT